LFDEFSMTKQGPLARFTGFTQDEVRRLCEEYRMDFSEMDEWYDGYLGYAPLDYQTSTVFIPNKELRGEYIRCLHPSSPPSRGVGHAH
jgi:hypothetical protein